MKTCNEIDSVMTPYVDGEALLAVGEEVEDHLAHCEPCRARAETEEAARRLVQSKASTLAVTLLLAVGGVFIAGQQERLEAAFAAQLAIDHEK